MDILKDFEVDVIDQFLPTRKSKKNRKTSKDFEYQVKLKDLKMRISSLDNSLQKFNSLVKGSLDVHENFIEISGKKNQINDEIKCVDNLIEFITKLSIDTDNESNNYLESFKNELDTISKEFNRTLEYLNNLHRQKSDNINEIGYDVLPSKSHTTIYKLNEAEIILDKNTFPSLSNEFGENPTFVRRVTQKFINVFIKIYDILTLSDRNTKMIDDKTRTAMKYLNKDIINSEKHNENSKKNGYSLIKVSLALFLFTLIFRLTIRNETFL